VRQKLILEAFKHLDTNKDGVLSLDEIKEKFDPFRHPDVLKGLKNAEEARFEFKNLFTSLHSANKGFKNDTRVTKEDFREWHAIINS
jgi:Ca2+-binding EF-hand superfamily protein